MSYHHVVLNAWARSRTKDPPERLWLRGDPSSFNFFLGATVAIVGARACSSYGRSVARSWARTFAENNVTVVSGLARGIDGEAHRGALEGGGKTIAVLGCGIDRDYPAAHAEMAHDIVEGGGFIVSEYEAGTPPEPWRFPARNRIIAGLSQAILVIEARERSGALITVDFAMEYSIPIYAIPGELSSPLSMGTNALIRDGHAQLVTTPEDVLSRLEP